MNTTTRRFALLFASAGALVAALPVAALLLTVPPAAGRASFAQGASAGKPAPATDRARVRDAFGTVETKAAGQSRYGRVSVGDVLPPGTTLRTGTASAALLELPDGHVVRVGASTTVALNTLGKDRSFSFRVLQGQIWSAVRKAAQPARYDVETPSAVAGVAGTVFCVAYDPATDETTVSTDEGLVNVRQEGGLTRPVSAGYYARLRAARIDRTRPVPPSVRQHGPAQKRMWMLLKQREHWMRHRTTPPVPLRPPTLYRNMEDVLRKELRTSGG